MVGVGMNVVFRFQAFGDLLAKVLWPFGHTVLQCGGATLVHHGVHRGLQVFHREELGRGQTAGEGDDLGPRGELEQLAHVRSPDIIHAVGKIYHFRPPLFRFIVKIYYAIFFIT